jgi:hypothetical protein
MRQGLLPFPAVFLLAALGPVGCGADGLDDGATAPVEQTLVGPPEPSPTLARPEVGYLGHCTGTLIHDRFMLSAEHCVGYPVAGRLLWLRFTLEDGTVLPDYRMDRSWVQPPWLEPSSPDFPKYGSEVASLNSDLWLARITTVVDSRVPRATLATCYPPAGTLVSIFGYGNFGAISCPGEGADAGLGDGQKRSRNYAWGVKNANPEWLLPGCSGDSGGPTFDAPLNGGNLMCTTGSATGAGSAIHFREQIYEQMRLLINSPNPPQRWLVGTRRSGTVKWSETAADAAACEAKCINHDTCQTWSLKGTTCSQMEYLASWIPAAGYTSGIRPITETGSNRAGGTLLTTVAAISATQCAASCGRDISCKAYVYAGPTDCKLYSTVGIRTSDASKVSGVKQATETSVNRATGDILPVGTTTTASLCADSCAKTVDCQAYTWVASNAKCYRKRAFSGPSTGQSGLTSAAKRRAPLPNVALGGTVVPGFEGLVTSPRTEEACRSACEQRKDESGAQKCVGYSTLEPQFGEPRKCWLFSNVTSERGYSDMYSGYTGLTFF